MAISEEQDEMARYEPSHLELHCLQKYLYWPAGMKRLTSNCVFRENRCPSTVNFQLFFPTATA